MNVTRWGILGAAKIAKDHVIPAMLKSKSTKLLAIASKDKNKAYAFQNEFGIEYIYHDYESLISHPNIDAVYIPLPNHLHVPLSIRLVEAGKHVLCEKPISIKSSELIKLIEAQRKTRKIVAEAFMVRFHKQWLKTKEIINQGEIGKLNSIQGSFCYFNMDPKNIRNDSKIGGGGLLDIGVYPIVTSRFISDKEPKRVVSLMQYDPLFKTDVLTSALLDFGDFHMSFTCSTQSHLMQHMRFIGSLGRMELPVPFNPIADKRTKINLWQNTSHPSEEPKVIELEAEDQYKVQIEMMNEKIQNGLPFKFSLEDSYKNMQVLDKIVLSSKSGMWEEI
tara:strand:- start:121 stop:1122 length:1002 start_codon:yes stop_codon:yes gene_type:complete